MLPEIRKLGWPVTLITPTADPLEALAIRLYKTLEIKSVADAAILTEDCLKTEKGAPPLA